MRLRRALAGNAAPGFQRDDRQIAVARDRRQLFEIPAIGNALQIQQQQFHLGIFGNRTGQFADRNVAIIAGGVAVAHADTLAQQKADRRGRQRAGLAQHRDMTTGAIEFGEQRRERDNGASAEIRQPLRIRPDDAHAGLARRRRHALLFGLAGDRIDLAEPGRHHHHGFHAARRAVFHRVDGVVAGHRHDRQLRRFRQIAERAIAATALDFGPAGIDRIDCALEPELAKIMDRPAADLVRIVGCADHGDRARIEKRAQTAHDPSRCRVARRCRRSLCITNIIGGIKLPVAALSIGIRIDTCVSI